MHLSVPIAKAAETDSKLCSGLRIFCSWLWNPHPPCTCCCLWFSIRDLCSGHNNNRHRGTIVRWVWVYTNSPISAVSLLCIENALQACDGERERQRRPMAWRIDAMGNIDSTSSTQFSVKNECQGVAKLIDHNRGKCPITHTTSIVKEYFYVSHQVKLQKNEQLFCQIWIFTSGKLIKVSAISISW